MSWLKQEFTYIKSTNCLSKYEIIIQISFLIDRKNKIIIEFTVKRKLEISQKINGNTKFVNFRGTLLNLTLIRGQQIKIEWIEYTYIGEKEQRKNIQRKKKQQLDCEKNIKIKSSVQENFNFQTIILNLTKKCKVIKINGINSQNYIYINPDMMQICDNNYYNDHEEEDYSQQKNEDYTLTISSEDYETKQPSTKSLDIISGESIDTSNNTKKRQPLKVLRKTGMVELHRNIDIEICFMLLGDIFIHKDVFIDCRDKRLTNICPVSAFRPVISTEKTDKYCLAYVDNTQSGIVDIKFPEQLLQKLNFDKAHQISQNLVQLLQFYKNTQQLQDRVKQFYNNDQLRIEYILAQNHQNSLQIAQQYLKRLTQEKIIMFHYKKIDPVTLTHKLHYSGSNMTMSELFTGHSDFSVMEQYMNRIGTPKYIDAQGMVNLTLSKFKGQTTFDLNLITLDDLIIPLTCTIKRIFLNEFEIIPGEKMSEYLDIHILDTHLNFIQDVLEKRKQPGYLQDVSQFEYEMKAEMFIQKFYNGSTQNAQNICA